MSKMRAQVGLVFNDADLFDNFIEPYKQQRELNSVIVRCLTAYYYNEEVRNLIEGLSLDDVASVGVEITSSQEICNSIRESLMVQDFLTSELKDTIDSGQEDIDDILTKTNDLAQSSGAATCAETEFGKGFLKLESKNLRTSESGVSSEQTTGDTSPERILHVLFKAIIKLAEASGNDEVLDILHGSNEQSDEVQNTEQQETVSQTVVDDFVLNENENSEILADEPEQKSEEVKEAHVIVEETPVVEEEIKEDEPEMEPEEDISDDVAEDNNSAHDSIMGLLGSLG